MKFVTLMLSFGLVACQVKERSNPAAETAVSPPQEELSYEVAEQLTIEQLKVSSNFSFETQTSSVVTIEGNGSLTTHRLQLFYDDIQEEHLVFETRLTELTQRVELTLPSFAQHIVALWIDDVNKTQVTQIFRLSDALDGSLHVRQPN